MTDAEFIKALTGQKIVRKKIYINKAIVALLKDIKKHIGSSLEMCELVECCYDHFDFSFITEEKNIEEFFCDKQEIVQMYIREDIIEKLNQIKEQSGVSIKDIISKITLSQIRKIEKILIQKNCS